MYMLISGLAIFSLIPIGNLLGLYSKFAITLATTVLIWGLFALSLDFVMGYIGLVSFGHAMFYGIGAYTAMLSFRHISPSIFIAIILAIILTSAIAWIVGYLSIRVSGVYFAMITLAFAQLFYVISLQTAIVGGSDGLFGANPFMGIADIGFYFENISVSLLNIQVGPTSALFYFTFIIVIISYLFSHRLMQSPFGSVLKAIGDNQRQSMSLGYDVATHKRRAFVVSGAMGGVAGALFTINKGFVAPSLLHWINSGEVVIMATLGGLGTLIGPVIGAGVLLTLESFGSIVFSEWMLVNGIIFVLFVIFIPKGIVSIPEKLLEIIHTSDHRFIRQFTGRHNKNE
jgi:branched-chain amino acid transport system permease protein